MNTIGIARDLDCTYDEALDLVVAALKTEGFGVLTEIDIKDKLKEKLGVEFRRYKILGACNPPLAHQALTADLAIGVLLPCSVVVYENDGGTATVIAVDPQQMMSTPGMESFAEVAAQVSERLGRVIASL